MFDAEKLRIHGHPVLAWAVTEQQSTGPCGYVLVDIHHAPDPSRFNRVKHEYVVAWYRSGDHEWAQGHYFPDGDYDRAWMLFVEKVSQTYWIDVNWRSEEST